jgi:hypothetical protein
MTLRTENTAHFPEGMVEISQFEAVKRGTAEDE